MIAEPSKLVEALSPERLAAERWFGGKERQTEAVRLADALAVGDDALLVVDVEFADGPPERYSLPHGRWGPLLAHPSGRFELRGAGALGPLARERPLGVDQSNSSYVLDERIVLKCYRRLHPGPHPEVELVTALRGVAEVPAARGSLHWTAPDGTDWALALLQAYVPEARDGWSWAQELLRSALEAGTAADRATAWAADLGAVTRRLHDALAASFGSRPAAATDLRGWRLAAEAQLEAVLGLVDSETAAELRAAAPQIRAELARLESPSEAPVLTRVHGDYHAGQILRSPAGFHVVDFEGEPTKPPEERRADGSPLRDVAAMLRSFDHLARWTLRAFPGQEAAAEAWIAGARERFLAGYGPHDAGLLRAFEVEKETYEFSYAASFLPEWTFVPRASLRALLA